jgi:hypothetical protein
MNVWDYQGSYGRPDAFPYFDAGPGLNAPNRDTLGWIPANRRASFGVPCCIGESGFQLAALTHPEAPGALMVTIPLDAPNHYYTVELRHKDSWDQAIPKDTVLIHEIRPDGHDYLVDTNGNAEFWYAGGPQWQVGDTFRDPTHGLRVSVLSMDSKSATATIDIGWGFMGLPNLNPGSGGGGNDASHGAPICGLGSVPPPVGGKTCAPIALQ